MFRWTSLNQQERQQCFSNKSKPNRILNEHGKYRCECWEIAGRLKQEWNMTVMQALLVALNQRSTASKIHATMEREKCTGVPMWKMYIVLTNGRPDTATPTIFALHRNLNVARAAYSLLKPLRKDVLKHVLRDYSVSYAEYSISLRTGPTSAEVWVTNPGRWLCGTHLMLERPSSDGSGSQWSQATMGGVIFVDGCHYGLTSAHAFHPLSTNPGPLIAGFDAHELESSKALEQDTTWNVYAQDFAPAVTLAQSPGNMPNQPVNAGDLVNGTLSGGQHASITIKPTLINRDMDWALVPIQNKDFVTRNALRDENGAIVDVTSIGQQQPTGRVVVGSSVASRIWRSFPDLASMIVLPGSNRVHAVWQLKQKTDAGDSGSWVIDESGHAFGMVVAASETYAESFCLPLAPILEDIRTSLGLEHAPTLHQDNVVHSVQQTQQSNVVHNDRNRQPVKTLSAGGMKGYKRWPHGANFHHSLSPLPEQSSPRSSVLSHDRSPLPPGLPTDVSEDPTDAEAERPEQSPSKVMLGSGGTSPEHETHELHRGHSSSGSLRQSKQPTVEKAETKDDDEKAGSLQSQAQAVNKAAKSQRLQEAVSGAVDLPLPPSNAENMVFHAAQIRKHSVTGRHQYLFDTAEVLPEALEHYGHTWEYVPGRSDKLAVSDVFSRDRKQELRIYSKAIRAERARRKAATQSDRNVEDFGAANPLLPLLHYPGGSQKQMVVSSIRPKPAAAGSTDQDDNFTAPPDDSEAQWAGRSLDMGFVIRVQGLCREAGCSMDFCDKIIAAHNAKERSIAEFIQQKTLPDETTATQTTQANHSQSIGKGRKEPVASAQPPTNDPQTTESLKTKHAQSRIRTMMQK